MIFFAWNWDPPDNLGQFDAIRYVTFDQLVAVLASFSIVDSDDGRIFGIGISPDTGAVVHPLIMKVPVVHVIDPIPQDWI